MWSSTCQQKELKAMPTYTHGTVTPAAQRSSESRADGGTSRAWQLHQLQQGQSRPAERVPPPWPGSAHLRCGRPACAAGWSGGRAGAAAPIGSTGGAHTPSRGCGGGGQAGRQGRRGRRDDRLLACRQRCLPQRGALPCPLRSAPPPAGAPVAQGRRAGEAGPHLAAVQVRAIQHLHGGEGGGGQDEGQADGWWRRWMQAGRRPTGRSQHAWTEGNRHRPP